ncbi:hypothetical protein J2X65_003506 [Ancylobacter sp. 3268]|uniref:hypothetical protein n=1 Tax=Ancylobacter sp. 3268 TaxID=2817752 RepID=UPI00285CDAD4|nr:hypothetical protein [Ancylobacter sp. 3268]MDR6954138.1 hypothetical protein [Ancylobacter sp. 3268]
MRRPTPVLRPHYRTPFISREGARALIAAAVLSFTGAAIPVALILNDMPQMPLVQRIASARADVLARPCFTDTDCRRRIAAHGVDPVYYEGPDEWLESGCLAKRDRTACAYLAAWRQIEP